MVERMALYRLGIALVGFQLEGACATAKAPEVQAPEAKPPEAKPPEAPGYVVSGTAETVQSSCGTPPYHQPARAVHVYRAGTRGESMTGRPYEVLTVSANRTFKARLPAGRYCLSVGGTAPICDAELVLPGPGASSVFLSHRLPMTAGCSYDEPQQILIPTP